MGLIRTAICTKTLCLWLQYSTSWILLLLRIFFLQVTKKGYTWSEQTPPGPKSCLQQQNQKDTKKTVQEWSKHTEIMSYPWAHSSLQQLECLALHRVSSDVSSILSRLLCNEIIHSHFEPRQTFSIPNILWQNHAFLLRGCSDMQLFKIQSIMLNPCSYPNRPIFMASNNPKVLPLFTWSKDVLIYKHHFPLISNHSCPPLPPHIQPAWSRIIAHK